MDYRFVFPEMPIPNSRLFERTAHARFRNAHMLLDTASASYSDMRAAFGDNPHVDVIEIRAVSTHAVDKGEYDYVIDSIRSWALRVGFIDDPEDVCLVELSTVFTADEEMSLILKGSRGFR